MFWTSNLYSLIKENWMCTITRRHGNNILLARNLPFDSGVRQWSHPLMMPLHCLWAKSNNRTRDQFECDMTFLLLLFLLDFVHSHARCGCCSIVYVFNFANKTGWLQNEYLKSFFKKIFADIFGQLYTQGYKVVKK